MNTWILVADGGRARMFACARSDAPLAEVGTLVNPAAHLHERDLVADRGGRGRGVRGGGHAVSESDAKAQAEDRFCVEVCAALATAQARGEYGRLYLIAAPAFLGRLRRHVSRGVQDAVVAEIDRDLTHLSAGELRTHLPQFL